LKAAGALAPGFGVAHGFALSMMEAVRGLQQAVPVDGG